MNIKKKGISFPAKLTILLGVFFVVMFVAVSLMFFYTGNVMKNEAIRRIEYNVEQIMGGIDDIILNIYNVSDAFALDERLQEYTDVEVKNIKEKRFITAQISNTLFESYDLLRKNEKMAAFYNNSTEELFNFLDPNTDDEECKRMLLAMNINGFEKLAKFHWYSVRDNFLKQDRTGDVRVDRAVIGSRRVFSRLQNAYTGVHIFAIEENEIYKIYKDIAEEYGADIYIISGAGDLLSSSDTDVIFDGYIDSALQKTVLERKFDRFDFGGDVVFVEKSKVNDWLTVVKVSENSMTAIVTKLQSWVFIILLLFAVGACAMIYILYRNFMHPISKLNDSMIKVHNGDMTAYVEVKGNNELARMMEYYNSMLDSVSRSIEERLHMEQHKKQLEMDVLMNQINPHFLYNTLESIVWKSSEAGYPDIGRIAAALGRMYRLSISGGALFVPIRQELEHVGAYIKIQKSRYEDAFYFEVDADYSVLGGLYTIKIILQPLVENSISHGMDGLERAMGLRLKVRVTDGSIKIRVVDNGCGMDRIKLGKVRRQILTGKRDSSENIIRKKSTGIGMHNVYERLKIYFGDESSISIWSKKNIGTIIDLSLPIVNEEDAKKKNDERDR